MGAAVNSKQKRERRKKRQQIAQPVPQDTGEPEIISSTLSEYHPGGWVSEPAKGLMQILPVPFEEPALKGTVDLSELAPKLRDITAKLHEAAEGMREPLDELAARFHQLRADVRQAQSPPPLPEPGDGKPAPRMK